MYITGREMSGTPADFAPVQSHKPKLKLGVLYSLRSIFVKGTQQGRQGWSWATGTCHRKMWKGKALEDPSSYPPA